MTSIESAEDYSLKTGEPLIVNGDAFGIPVRFICTADKGWVVPVVDISKAIGISKQSQSKMLKSHESEFKPFLTTVNLTLTVEQTRKVKHVCLTRDGITMYLMKLTPSRMEDPEVGKKISEFQIRVVKTFGEHLDYYKIPQWWARREAVKLKYRGMTEAIQDHLLIGIPEDKQWLVYATEADLLNVIIFGMTAKEAGCNQRNTASSQTLALLEHLEESNHSLIRLKFPIHVRYEKLCELRDDLITHNRYQVQIPERALNYNQYVKY